MNDREKWPGTDLAYELAKSSYSIVADRLDSVNRRIQSLVSLSVTITLAVPTIARAVYADVPFESGWFWGGCLAFLATLCLGAYGRVGGTLDIFDPMVFHQKWLSLEPPEFKRHFTYYAGEAFNENRSLVNRKGNIALTMTILLTIEVGLFLGWLTVL